MARFAPKASTPIYRDKTSGKSAKNRPELEKVIERVHKRGASVKALDRDYLDLTKPINRGILAFLSALAEDERHRILKRANDGRTAAKAKGTRFGRKPKLTAHQQAEALKRLAAGESCRSIARTMAVHHATVARLAG